MKNLLPFTRGSDGHLHAVRHLPGCVEILRRDSSGHLVAVTRLTAPKRGTNQIHSGYSPPAVWPTHYD